MAEPMPLMYADLAPWFHLLTPPSDYEGEATEIAELLRETVEGSMADLLELGSGGGNLASRLDTGVRLTLTDRSADMLDLSRAINPGATHTLADMRDVRLDATFDAVLVHDAIGYMLTEADLRAAFETAFVHLRSGGAALFAPDAVLDDYTPRSEAGGTDGDDGRGVRYLEWDRAVEAGGHTVVTDYIIATRDADGTTNVYHDRHRFGTFPRATWLELLADVGFDPRVVRGSEDLDLFVAAKR